MWVPSHLSIPVNKEGDAMADEAVTSESTSYITKSTTKDLINEAQKRILTTWQSHWDDIPTSNKLRNVKKTVAKWPYPVNASRREQIIINRAIIGHFNITDSYLITKEPKPMCDACNTPLTIEHIIINCPKFAFSRHLLKNSSLEKAFNQFKIVNI